eukprot:3371038-Rhodomonas_salina.1
MLRPGRSGGEEWEQLPVNRAVPVNSAACSFFFPQTASFQRPAAACEWQRGRTTLSAEQRAVQGRVGRVGRYT